MAVRPPPHGFSRGWEASKTRDRGAVAREARGEQRARRARAHDATFMAQSARPRSAARTSSGVAVAVPTLPTTTPAA